MSARPVCRSCGAHRHEGEAHTFDCKSFPQIGGGYCPCSGWVAFYTDEGRDEWDQIHALCEDAS